VVYAKTISDELRNSLGRKAGIDLHDEGQAIDACDRAAAPSTPRRALSSVVAPGNLTRAFCAASKQPRWDKRRAPRVRLLR
jgi:hypothetical protein